MHIWPSSWQKLSLNGWKWKPERMFILMFSSCPENNTIDQSMDNHMVLLLHHGMKTFVSLFPSYLASLFHVSKIWNKSHRNLGGSVRWAKISPEWNSYWTESKLHPVNGKEKEITGFSATVLHFLQLLHLFLEWLSQVTTAQLKMPRRKEIHYLSSFSRIILFLFP